MQNWKQDSVITTIYYLCTYITYNGISTLRQGIGHTAGISLYKDNLYDNLYVMPIFDVWNHV
jgi:hypothetical protein